MPPIVKKPLQLTAPVHFLDQNKKSIHKSKNNLLTNQTTHAINLLSSNKIISPIRNKTFFLIKIKLLVRLGQTLNHCLICVHKHSRFHIIISILKSIVLANMNNLTIGMHLKYAISGIHHSLTLYVQTSWGKG